MTDQKLENLLNLALGATVEERQKSLELDVGYDASEQEWDLIVKYSGDLSQLRELGVQVVELQNEYAIVTIRESLIGRLSDFPQVEFVEKPKRLFFAVESGKTASCIPPVQRPPYNLSGKGVLVAVIDSGIDYANPVFRNLDGSTRIRALWDQSLSENPPAGYAIGTEYTQEQINEALRQTTVEARRQLVPSQDTSGHGTAVAGVAVGNGEEYRGVAYESELLVVKLGLPKLDGFPRTTELMQAIDYVVRKALEYGQPVAINISFGNTYGAHDGNSLLEQFIQDIANRWKSVICIGTGNEGNTAGHVSGRLNDSEEMEIELAVQENEAALNVQIWKAYYDVIDISLQTPSGVRVGPFQERLGMQRFRVGETELLMYYGEPSPYTIDQEIFIDFLPRVDYVNSGIWKIILTPRDVINGNYALWLPSANVLNQGTEFLQASPSGSLTIPSTAFRTIGVGAYNSETMTYADFSGRGAGARIKPDLVAPGVDIIVPLAGGGFAELSGTSFATPFVTGAAALLMQWGIVDNHDPFLYGEKVKAYLQRGSREILGFTEYPNQSVGYGALCVRDSLPQ
ncbi:MAG: S8 family peptidase [Faecalimonas sp.]|nr:S8 family peptidase [Faecalimonas sp.]